MAPALTIYSTAQTYPRAKGLRSVLYEGRAWVSASMSALRDLEGVKFERLVDVRDMFDDWSCRRMV